MGKECKWSCVIHFSIELLEKGGCQVTYYVYNISFHIDIKLEIGASSNIIDSLVVMHVWRLKVCLDSLLKTSNKGQENMHGSESKYIQYIPLFGIG